MPVRSRIELRDVADWDYLCLCAIRAARGKRHRDSVIRYFDKFEQSTADVQQSLLNCRLPRGHYRSFLITDPKPRVIHAAPFPDRVAHHAIIGRIAERLERSWVDSSYACRAGKGSHAAVEKAQSLAEHYPWLLKMDVHSYFANVDHEILLRLLARFFKSGPLFTLLSSVLETFSTFPGKGLPIGALTSQYFANHYLDGFQRFLKSHPLVDAEIRYMDDTLIACRSSAHANTIAKAAAAWLREYRQLSIKQPVIQRSAVGVTYCGFIVSARGLRMGQRRLRSIARHYKNIARSYRTGQIDELQLQRQIHTVIALSKPGNNDKLMSRIISRHGVESLC